MNNKVEKVKLSHRKIILTLKLMLHQKKFGQ